MSPKLEVPEDLFFWLVLCSTWTERKKLLEEGRAFVRSLCIEEEEEGGFGGGGMVKSRTGQL